MRNRIRNLSLCLLAGVGIVVILYEWSGLQRHQKGGFIRLLPSHVLVPGKIIDLKFNSYYIVGLTKDSIYLASMLTPYWMTSLSFTLGTRQERHINWLATARIRKGARMEIDSPFVFLNDGMSQKVFRMNMIKFAGVAQYSTPPFTAATALTVNTQVYRCIASDRKNVLVKNSFGSKSLIIAKDLLKDGGDGIFSTDGMLVPIPHTARFIYVYYYRNPFFCADSNMQVVYRSRTIDTVSHAPIKVAMIRSEGKITMASPRQQVNRLCAVNDKFLFVNSMITADNEGPPTNSGAQAIDVYTIQTGKYLFTFHLPDIGGKRVSDFQAYGNQLVAIHDHFLTVYKLNLNGLTRLLNGSNSKSN